MANHTGVEGVARLGAIAIAEVRGWTLDFDFTLISTMKLGSLWRTNKTGSGGAKGKIMCFWDETDAAGQEAMMTAALNRTPVTLNLMPEGAQSGDTYFALSAYLDSVGIDNSDNDAMVLREFSFSSDGAVTQVVVP